KTSRKRSKSKTSARKKTRSTTRKPARKKQSARKQLSKKKAPPKKAATKRQAASGRKTTATQAASAAGGQVRRGTPVPPRAFSRQGLGAGAAGQSGDLQGLSRREDADSESVEELLEEGNALEAGVIAGVEEADEAEEKEVHTHEVPEDDVPS